MNGVAFWQYTAAPNDVKPAGGVSGEIMENVILRQFGLDCSAFRIILLMMNRRFVMKHLSEILCAVLLFTAAAATGAAEAEAEAETVRPRQIQAEKLSNIFKKDLYPDRPMIFGTIRIQVLSL